MSKLLLGVSVLAFGALMSVSGIQAAPRVGGAAVMSVNSKVPNWPCANCGISGAPRPGDTVTLNPQPLPPKIYRDGRMLRR